MKFILSLLLLMASFSVLALDAGKMAPDFSLKGHDGKTYKLSDFKGKHVVLEWYNVGCPFVKKHYEPGNMQKLQADYTKKGIVWLQVVSSAPGKQGHVTQEEAKKLVKEQKANSTALLMDPNGKVGKMYDAKTTPHMYIINPQGKLVYQGAIDSMPTTDSDDIPKARNYVTEALDALMKGKTVKVAQTKAYGCSVKY
jgi:peroxiredoxin